MAVALRNAATLKPEIRLAQALSEYEAILTDDQKAKLRTYHGQQPPGATDVMRLTAEIDRENSNRKGRRCVGPRLTNVLQAVQQFSTIVDTIVGGSQSQIASAIWGVLKMSIQVTPLQHFNCYH
jgi:ankyrin repeat domain-containing protein 50